MADFGNSGGKDRQQEEDSEAGETEEGGRDEEKDAPGDATCSSTESRLKVIVKPQYIADVSNGLVRRDPRFP